MQILATLPGVVDHMCLDSNGNLVVVYKHPRRWWQVWKPATELRCKVFICDHTACELYGHYFCAYDLNIDKCLTCGEERVTLTPHHI